MKTYIVTGASSGIGLATCQRLIKTGHHVIGIARDFSSTPFLGKTFFAYEADLADLPAIPLWAPKLALECSQLHGIILCAGQGKFGALESFSWEQLSYFINLNLTSQLFILKAFIPLLKKQSESDIILIGSEASLTGSKQGTIYCASKFGLRGAAQSLRKEYANDHIRISLINPGAVDTDFFDTLAFQPEQHSDYKILAETVADSIMHVLSLPSNTVIEELNVQPLKRAFKSKAKK